MADHQMYDDLPVLGNMKPKSAISKLRSVGEHKVADLLWQSHFGGIDTSSVADFEEGDKLTYVHTSGFFGPSRKKEIPKYLHTSHSFGFIGAGEGKNAVPLESATALPQDESLRNSRINIYLDALRAAEYPGRGAHRVLFDFNAQNQVTNYTQDLHFNSTLRIQEGESAAVAGHPVFIGLSVPPNGVALKCLTVNVKNDADERFLAALESTPFNLGLKLATALQPAIVPLTELAIALTKSIAKRRRNMAIQEFYLGLDFNNAATGMRLREGSYVAVQMPDEQSAAWNWSKWVYDTNSRQIVSRDDKSTLLPYNYIILRVSCYKRK